MVQQLIDVTPGAGDTGTAGGGKINANFSELYGGIDQAVISGRWLLPAHGPADGNQAFSANIAYAFPVVFKKAVTLLGLGINVSASVAASTALLGIYNDNAGSPDTLNAQLTTSLSTASTGTQTGTFLGSSLTLAAGRYWLAALLSAGPSLFGISTSDRTLAFTVGNATLSNVMGQFNGSAWSMAQTYGSGLPASMSTATAAGLSWPAIAFRFV